MTIIREDTGMEDCYFPKGTEHHEIYKSIGNRYFVWDDAKNKHNIKVHHVDFETAMFVFNDENRIEIYDEAHSEIEERWNTIGQPMDSVNIENVSGLTPTLTLGKVHNLLFVVFTDRIIMGKEMVRLISARRATKFEELLYQSGE